MQDQYENEVPVAEPKRCVIVVSAALDPGRAANAAAVVALTLGQRAPYLVGGPLTDADGTDHPGLIPIGIAVLAAPMEALGEVRSKAVGTGLEVVDFPVQGQMTTNYAGFQTMVKEVKTQDLQYLAVGIVGPKKQVGKIVGGFALLK